MSNVDLLSFSKGSGCGCKLHPEALQALLKGLRSASGSEGLLVGNDLSDDCSVFDLGNGQLLLQTVDFFTPIINDAFLFGAAAAANALSDIWAMGGKPLMANAVFSWPSELPLELGRAVLQGATDICNKANVALAGGHTVDGKEPLFGLSVTGTATLKTLKTNAGAKPGDRIAISKPLGVGMLAAACKRGLANSEIESALVSTLTTVNQIGEMLGNHESIHAMTDVTGFGLGGHLLEMCEASGCSASIDGSKLPKIAAAEPLAASFILPDNAMRNWNSIQEKVALKNQSDFPWLCDPQTNGGLLIAVNANEADTIAALFPQLIWIGEFTEKAEKPLAVN